MPLPATERVLLGPGPSLITPRVMRALAAPVLSHLDPDFVPLLDDVRESLQRVFRADTKSLTLATSGTGTSAMEAAVANVVSDGMRGVVIVTRRPIPENVTVLCFPTTNPSISFAAGLSRISAIFG